MYHDLHILGGQLGRHADGGMDKFNDKLTWMGSVI